MTGVMTMKFTLEQAEALVAAFGGDYESTMIVGLVDESGGGHSGPGLYAYSDESPEDGSEFLG